MASSWKRAEVVSKYFIKTPEEPNYSCGQIVMGIGGLLICGGILLSAAESEGNSEDIGCFVGLALLFGGFPTLIGFLIYSVQKSRYEKAYNKAEPKATDREMDTWLEEDVERIRRESIDKLDLISEQIIREPKMVIGPSNSSLVERGRDRMIRFSMYDILIVYLTNYHLAAYKCTLDMAHGTTKNESTQEYHYTDVVSVSTQSERSNLFTVIVNGKEESIDSYQKFALSVASGERIEVVTSLPQLDGIIESGNLPPSGAPEAMKTIRAMLREKKGGIDE